MFSTDGSLNFYIKLQNGQAVTFLLLVFTQQKKKFRKDKFPLVFMLKITAVKKKIWLKVFVEQVNTVLFGSQI